MNKTININLASTFFHIDEDAYRILKQYLTSLERTFQNTQGKEDIMNDIEMRIAELFQERKKHTSYVFNTADVEQVIQVLGQPEDFISGALDEEQNEDHNARTKNTTHTSKKFFRDTDDRYIGGVASGLAHYLGIDPTWMRLALLFAAVFSAGTFFMVYVVLWILVPEAKTTADKLRMKGEPININNIEKKIKEDFEKVSEKFKDDYEDARSTVKKKSENFFGQLEHFLKSLFRILFKIIGLIIVFVAFMGCIGWFLSFFLVSVFGMSNSFINPYIDFFNTSNTFSILVWIAIFLVVIIPLLGLFALGRKFINPRAHFFGLGGRWTIAGLWIGSVFILSIAAVNQIRQFAFTADHYTQELLLTQPSDTLLLKATIEKKTISQNPIIRSDWIFRWRHHRFFGQYDERVRLQIKPNNNPENLLEFYTTADGPKWDLAKQYAQNINYNWQEEDHTLWLDPSLNLEIQDRFRRQSLEMTLYLEEGQILYIDRSVLKMLDQTIPNDQDYSRSRMGDHYWKMHNDQLECLDCVPKKEI